MSHLPTPTTPSTIKPTLTLFSPFSILLFHQPTNPPIHQPTPLSSIPPLSRTHKPTDPPPPSNFPGHPHRPPRLPLPHHSPPNLTSPSPSVYQHGLGLLPLLQRPLPLLRPRVQILWACSLQWMLVSEDDVFWAMGRGMWGWGSRMQEWDHGRKALECRALPGVIYPW